MLMTFPVSTSSAPATSERSSFFARRAFLSPRSERAVIFELHRFFRPELIGRFDEKIVFRPLSSEVQREICRAAIDLEIERFSEHGFNLTVSEAAFEFLVRRGIHKALGARPMKKTVQKFIGDAVRDALKAGCHHPAFLLFRLSTIG